MTEIRPDYYKSGGLEAFDVIDAFELDFNLGNAFKYIARAGKKDNKIDDLRKAVTYLNREIEKWEKLNVGKIERPDAFEKAVRGCKRESMDESCDFDIVGDGYIQYLGPTEKSDYEAGRQKNV